MPIVGTEAKESTRCLLVDGLLKIGKGGSSAGRAALQALWESLCPMTVARTANVASGASASSFGERGEAFLGRHTGITSAISTTRRVS